MGDCISLKTIGLLLPHAAKMHATRADDRRWETCTRDSHDLRSSVLRSSEKRLNDDARVYAHVSQSQVLNTAIVYIFYKGVPKFEIWTFPNRVTFHSWRVEHCFCLGANAPRRACMTQIRTQLNRESTRSVNKHGVNT